MLNIYVNTWGNYNENGADGGEWLSLPMDADELETALERIAEAMGDHDPEWFVNDYEWEGEYSFRSIEEGERFGDLNEYAQQLDALDKWDLEKYAAAVEAFGGKYVDIDDLDEYNLYSDIGNDYDLGYYWAMESGCYDLEKMGHLANYIDYEAFGRDIRFDSDGAHTDYGWIERC